AFGCRAITGIRLDPRGGILVEDRTPPSDAVAAHAAHIGRMRPARAAADQQLVGPCLRIAIAVDQDEAVAVFAANRLLPRPANLINARAAGPPGSLGVEGRLALAIGQQRLAIQIDLPKVIALAEIGADVPAPDIIAAQVDIVEILFG